MRLRKKEKKPLRLDAALERQGNWHLDFWNMTKLICKDEILSGIPQIHISACQSIKLLTIKEKWTWLLSLLSLNISSEALTKRNSVITKYASKGLLQTKQHTVFPCLFTVQYSQFHVFVDFIHSRDSSGLSQKTQLKTLASDFCVQRRTCGGGVGRRGR